MKRLPRWKWWLASIGVVLCFSILGAVEYFGVWRIRDVQAYLGMPSELDDTPVWKALALRRIRPGQSVDDLLAVSHPQNVCRHDIWTTIKYGAIRGDFTGLTVIAKRDRLVYAAAWSCEWDHEFFNVMPGQEWQPYEASWRTFVAEYIAARRAAREAALDLGSTTQNTGTP